MPKLTDRTLRAEAAASASGQGSAVDIGVDTTLDLDLAVTAISGVLNVFVDTSRDGAIGWTEVVPRGEDEGPVRFAQVTAVGAQFLVFPDCERYVRVRWTLTGTATFRLTGKSVRVYAKTTDVPGLAVGCNCKKRSSERIDRAIREQTDTTDSALGMQGPVPLETWGQDVRGGCATCAGVAIIIEDGMKLRQEDEHLIEKCKAYDAWLDLVASGKRKPANAVDTTPTVEDGGAYAVTDQKRGW